MPREGLHSQATLDSCEELLLRDDLSARLSWVVMLRWAALAGVLILVSLAHRLELVTSPWPLWGIGAALAFLNLGFGTLHRSHPGRTLRALTSEALLQCSLDAIGLGLLIFFSGGLANPFLVCLLPPTLCAAILLDRRLAFRVAALTVTVVFFLALAEHMEGLAPWPLLGSPQETPPTPLARTGLVLALVTTLLISVYLVASAIERLRTRSRDVQRRAADLAARLELLSTTAGRLTREQERARAILESMNEGVVVVDLTGKVLLANAVAIQRVLVTLEDSFRRAGVQIEPAPIARTGMEAPSGPPPAAGSAPDCATRPAAAEACLTEAFAQGGKLSPEALQLLGADAPKPAKALKLRAPPAPALVEVECRGRRFENTVSAVRTAEGETLGLLVVSRDITERR